MLSCARFSLFNRGKGPKAAQLHFHFALCADGTSPLVLHAKRRWKGTARTAKASNCTMVNLEALGNLAEGCATVVLRAFDEGRLISQLPADELVERYTFAVRVER